MAAYYSEFDPKAAAWLRELIKRGLIADGEVDERDLWDVTPDDIRAFTQVHFCAGIGVWSYALRNAGWPDDRPVWTASFPCQPFSAAGKGKGFADERHLWPAGHFLIEECRPPVVFGEQVASKDGREWLVGVRADLEGMGYAVGAADLCAAGVGAPHLRQRLYWVADSDGRESGHGELQRGGQHGQQSQDGGARGDGWRRVSFAADCLGGDAETGEPGSACSICGGEYSECGCPGPTQDGYEYTERDGTMYARRVADAQHDDWRADEPRRGSQGRVVDGWIGGLADVQCAGLEGHAGNVRDRSEPGRIDEDQAGPTAAGGATGSVGDADGEHTGRNSGAGDCEEAGHPMREGCNVSESPGSTRLVVDSTSRGRGDAAQPGRCGHVERAGWSRFEIVHCRDGKARRFEPGSFPLAHGIPGRVGLLRGYGNAIVPQVAAEFVSAFMEVILPPAR